MDDVRVWLVDCERDLPRHAASTLREDELARAGRFRHAADRRRFVATRSSLRVVVGEATGVPPAAVRFRRRCSRCGSTDHGKPAVDSARPEVEFSVSHAGSLAIVALALAFPVGVDIEDVGRPVDRSGIAARYFDCRDAAEIRAAPAERRSRLFFERWTRKEALVKATGRGLGDDLRGVPTQLGAVTEPSSGARAWLSELAVPLGYVGALATITPAAPTVTVEAMSWADHG